MVLVSGFQMTEQLICARSFTTDWWRERAEASPRLLRFFLGGCAGEKGGLKNPYQIAPTPSRNPGPKEKNPIQLCDAVDRLSTDI